MGAEVDAFNKISKLQRNAREFATFWDRYKKHTADTNVDKHNAAFGGDQRFANFRVGTFFDSHSGVYGNSSCSNFGRFDSDVAEEYMVRAMNAMREQLFTKAAELMQKDAAALVDKAREEVAAMNAKLDAVLSAPTP